MQKVLYHIIKRKSRPYNYKQIYPLIPFSGGMFLII